MARALAVGIVLGHQFHYFGLGSIGTRFFLRFVCPVAKFFPAVVGQISVHGNVSGATKGVGILEQIPANGSISMAG